MKIVTKHGLHENIYKRIIKFVFCKFSGHVPKIPSLCTGW